MWCVFFERDGRFGHARHRDINRLIAWTLDEWRDADPAAFAAFMAPASFHEPMMRRAA